MQALYDQAIFFTFYLSLTLVIMYVCSAHLRKKISPFLIVLLGAIFLGLLGKIFYITEIFGKTYKLIIVSELAGMMFGASIFLLIRGLIENRSFLTKDLKHYLPAVVYFSLVAVYFIIPDSRVLSERADSGQLQKVVYFFFTIGLSVNITYGIAAWKLYNDFNRDLESEVSFIPRTAFIKRFLLFYGVILVVWVAVYVLSFIDVEMITNLSRKAIWLSLSMAVLFLTYYGFFTPDIYLINPVGSKPKYAQSKLSSIELDQLKQKLDSYMEEKKPYLNKKLMKNELAMMLDLSDPDLARLLNEKIGMNFFEYVNYYRIHEFIKLSTENNLSDYTFYGLAQEAGFNSKTTFNKSFKKIIGSSPTQYFKGRT